MKKKIFALALAAIMVASLAACGSTDSTDDETPAPVGTAVEVTTVETGDIATENTVTGSVTANRNVPVICKVACKVKSVNVKSGDTVKAGQSLFTLDTSDLQDTYGTAIDTYNSTKTLLDEQVRQTQESLDNLQQLYAMGAVSKTTVDQTSLGLLQAQTTRDSTLAQMGLDDVMSALSSPAVTSPIAGTVSSVGVTAGVMITSSTPAMVISEIGHPQVVVSVSETIQPYISVGDSIEVSIPSVSDDPITGTIASVASTVSQNTALYEVHIDIPDSLNVSIGMFAKVTFKTDARYGTVLIPTEAILTGDDSRYVFIVDGDTAYRIDITAGLVGETQTEILSGLNGGEQLVTRGQSYLSDGAPVRVTEG